MPTFDTPRLHVRPLGQADEALYCRLYTDPEVMRHIAAPLSAEAAAVAFATVTRLLRQDVPTMQAWVLHDRASQADVGIVALIRRAHAPDAREIGTMLLVTGQGRGFAVEAQAAVLDWVFTTPGVRIVASSHAPGHRAVMAVKQRLGFARTAPGADPPADVLAARAHARRVHWQVSRQAWHARRPAQDGKT